MVCSSLVQSCLHGVIEQRKINRAFGHRSLAGFAGVTDFPVSEYPAGQIRRSRRSVTTSGFDT